MKTGGFTLAGVCVSAVAVALTAVMLASCAGVCGKLMSKAREALGASSLLARIVLEEKEAPSARTEELFFNGAFIECGGENAVYTAVVISSVAESRAEDGAVLYEIDVSVYSEDKSLYSVTVYAEGADGG